MFITLTQKQSGRRFAVAITQPFVIEELAEGCRIIIRGGHDVTESFDEVVEKAKEAESARITYLGDRVLEMQKLMAASVETPADEPAALTEEQVQAEVDAATAEALAASTAKPKRIHKSAAQA